MSPRNRQDWTESQQLELIKLYEKRSYLWNTSAVFNREPYLRQETYQDMAEALRAIRPDTTARDVENQIGWLRRWYRKDKENMLLDEQYSPRLFCYGELSFLHDYTIIKTDPYGNLKKFGKFQGENKNKFRPKPYTFPFINTRESIGAGASSSTQFLGQNASSTSKNVEERESNRAAPSVQDKQEKNCASKNKESNFREIEVEIRISAKIARKD